MHNIRAKISSATGGLHLANPLAKPDAGNIIAVNDIPDEVSPADALRQLGRIVLWPAAGDSSKPAVLNWDRVQGLAQGALLRY